MLGVIFITFYLTKTNKKVYIFKLFNFPPDFEKYVKFLNSVHFIKLNEFVAENVQLNIDLLNNEGASILINYYIHIHVMCIFHVFKEMDILKESIISLNLRKLYKMIRVLFSWKF